MLIHGFPPAAKLPGDGRAGDRFWYWRGASGRNYIHSIYGPETCPPLPGAVYVVVRKLGPLRIAIATGRFSPVWDGPLDLADYTGADEIHVHLLARDEANAEAIFHDLEVALEDRDQPSRAAA